MKNEGALKCVFQACRNLSVRCVITSFYPWAAPAFRSGGYQGIGHAGKNMPCPSSAMSSGYSSIGVVATRARLRFADKSIIKHWTIGPKGIIIEPQGVG